MQFIKAIDAWAYGNAIRHGQIKLQRGQWIRLGADGGLSRFDSANAHHIRAFHSPSSSKKFMSYVQQGRDAEELKAHKFTQVL